MPFGLGVADWDVLLTDDQLTLFFRQLEIINESPSTVLALLVHFRDAGRVASAMEARGYVDVHPFYVYKPQQNQRGTGCFIFAVEVVVVGYKAASRDRVLSFPHANPLFRHNLLFGHNVTSRWKASGAGDDVNTTQKHPGVARHLASIFCTPGSNALVIGAGSGSDVIGCVQAGVNVVAVERCPVQFQGASARLVDFKTNYDAAQAEASLEVAQVQHLREAASSFTNWSPDDDKDPEPPSVDQKSSSSSSPAAPPRPHPAAPEEGGECVACGEVVPATEAHTCQRGGCRRRGGMHLACMHSCGEDGCDVLACSGRCLRAHREACHPSSKA